MLKLHCGPAGPEQPSLDAPTRSFSRNGAPGKYDVLFILIAW